MKIKFSNRIPTCFLFYKFDPIITNDYRIPDGNYSLRWIDDIKQLHSHNTYFIANELFDAYPIHKFQVINLYKTKNKISFLLQFKENSTRLERNFD